LGGAPLGGAGVLAGELAMVAGLGPGAGPGAGELGAGRAFGAEKALGAGPGAGEPGAGRAFGAGLLAATSEPPSWPRSWANSAAKVSCRAASAASWACCAVIRSRDCCSSRSRRSSRCKAPRAGWQAGVAAILAARPGSRCSSWAAGASGLSMRAWRQAGSARAGSRDANGRSAATAALPKRARGTSRGHGRKALASGRRAVRLGLPLAGVCTPIGICVGPMLPTLPPLG
jgi:hypothetical protein